MITLIDLKQTNPLQINANDKTNTGEDGVLTSGVETLQTTVPYCPMTWLRGVGWIVRDKVGRTG